MKFKAAMFDFDGTLTEKGEYHPPQEIADALVNLSQKMPIGFCTGRQLESFKKHGLSELLKEVNDKERPNFWRIYICLLRMEPLAMTLILPLVILRKLTEQIGRVIL